MRSPRTVTFRDYSESDGIGIAIEFRDPENVIRHTEFIGDADYNGVITDWILFGTYEPVSDREGW